MVAPGGGVILAHHEYVIYHLVNSSVWISPDGMEEHEGCYMDSAFHRKFTKQEVESSLGGSVAQFQKAPEDFVVED